MTSSAIQSRRKRAMLPRTWRGWLGWIAFALVLLVVLAWILSRSTPGWYRPLHTTDNDFIDNIDRAQAIAMDSANLLGRVPLGEQRWTIREVEVNSLLAKAFAFDDSVSGSPAVSPRVVSEPMVIFGNGSVTIAARTPRIPSGDPRGGVASAVFSVGIVAGTDGKPMGLVKLTSAWIGNLPVPTSLVERRMKGVTPAILAAVDEVLRNRIGRNSSLLTEIPDAEALLHSLVEGQPFPLEYTTGRRKFIIKELRVDAGEFTLVLGPITPAAVMPQPAPSR